MANPISISNTLTLYRYDKTIPPTTWDNSFKNSEYDYLEIGHKNESGLFFFTDSINIANTLGKKYCGDFYLTDCETIMPINIIDFSYCINIFQMVCVLVDLNIYILNDNFKTYSDKPTPHVETFSKLKPLYDDLLIGKGKIIDFNIGISDYEDVGLFGQRLTDFQNASSFINLTKHLGYDGYRWREFEDQRGLTYCLFDSEKLSPPVSRFIPMPK